VVRPGDVVFNKLRTWQGGLGVSRHLGVVSPAYYVCRPVPDIDSRYYHYLLRSAIYLAELTRLSKFMPPSQFDIAWDDLKTLTRIFRRDGWRWHENALRPGMIGVATHQSLPKVRRAFSWFKVAV
jgi:hypothetical protein